jgi:hypothetical protein
MSVSYLSFIIPANSHSFADLGTKLRLIFGLSLLIQVQYDLQIKPNTQIR